MSDEPPHRAAPATLRLGPSVLVAVLLLLLARCAQPIADAPPPPRPPIDPLVLPAYSPVAQELLAGGQLRGVALGLFSQDPGYDYTPLLREIRSLNCPWVSLCINHYQEGRESVEIGIPDRRTASFDRIRITIRQAHRLGLRVLVFPILLLRDPGEDDWRGTIAPTSRDAWHANYRRLLLRYASLAEEEGVEVLSIGSEFNSMEGERAPWESLIGAIRAEYSGALTYSVNWDSLDGPAFLDLLDFVGMTTYFSLTEKDDPTPAELVAACRKVQSDLAEWMTHLGQPVIFTEVGFASQNGINKDPWNYYISTEVDLQEQYDCYQAFSEVWRPSTRLGGVFFYNWFGFGGPRDTGYTPRGKPALDVLRTWFSRESTGVRRP